MNRADEIEWRHIATAPRDGTHFEARCGTFHPFDCYFDGWIFAHDDPDDGTISYKPNLWRPYPQGVDPNNPGEPQ